jgi:hypothetical protein
MSSVSGQMGNAGQANYSAFPGETSCLTTAWAVMDLVIAGSRGLGLTLPDRHAITALVAARAVPQTAQQIA